MPRNCPQARRLRTVCAKCFYNKGEDYTTACVSVNAKSKILWKKLARKNPGAIRPIGEAARRGEGRSIFLRRKRLSAMVCSASFHAGPDRFASPFSAAASRRKVSAFSYWPASQEKCAFVYGADMRINGKAVSKAKPLSAAQRATN